MTDVLKHRILVVDDEPAVRNILGAILESTGYEVDLAEDGFDALLQLRRRVPALLISDLQMPRMSGFELLSVMRRRFPQVLVVATSGAYDCADIVPGGVLADAFHPKGQSDPRILMNIVAGLITNSVNRVAAHRMESAPVWIPRNGQNATGLTYIVLTCTECLRSFPSIPSGGDLQRIEETECVFCDNRVRYIVDFSHAVGSTGAESVRTRREASILVDSSQALGATV